MDHRVKNEWHQGKSQVVNRTCSVRNHSYRDKKVFNSSLRATLQIS